MASLSANLFGFQSLAFKVFQTFLTICSNKFDFIIHIHSDHLLSFHTYLGSLFSTLIPEEIPRLVYSFQSYLFLFYRVRPLLSSLSKLFS